MKDCLSDMERSKVLADKIDETRGQVEANEEAIREYEATKQHLRKQISNVQDKLFRLQRDFEEKKHTTTLALEELQSEKLSLERNLGKEKHQADQNNLLLRQKMEQMKLMEESHERDMEVLRGKYEELNTTVRGYHERMLAAMKGTDYSSSNQNRQNQNNLNQQHQQPQPQQAHTPSATSSKSLIPVMAAPPSTPLSANEKALVPVDLQQQYSEEQDGHDAQSDAQPSKPAYTYTPTATKSSANGTTTQRNHTPYMRSNSADTATTPSSRKTPSKLLSLR